MGDAGDTQEYSLEDFNESADDAEDAVDAADQNDPQPAEDADDDDIDAEMSGIFGTPDEAEWRLGRSNWIS